MRLYLFFNILTLFSCTSFEGNRKMASIDAVENEGSFYATASCAISCNGSDLKMLTTEKRKFDPKDTPITHSNGGLVPTLTLRLGILADTLCLETAARTCGDLKAISHVESKSISSGSWSVPLPLECSKTSCVVSPYEDPSRLEKAVTRSKNPVESLNFASKNKRSGCRKELKFKSCFGDCMSDHPSCGTKKEFIQTVASPDPGGRSEVEICMDDLEATFQKDKTPAAVRPILCRIYARSFFLDQQSLELSCSAYRIDTDPCDQYGR